MKVVTNDAATARLEAQHLKVQAQIDALPADKKKAIKGVQKLVDDEIEKNNALFFSDGMFAVDAFLKRNKLLGTDKDDLLVEIEKTKVGSVFVFRNKSFIKSFDGLVHSTQDYIRSLEMTIAEQVQFKEVKYVTYDSGVDKLSFVGTIKLAFKNLMKGNKNG